jgi:hypothetical protein
MKTHGVHSLLTFDVDDFTRYAGIDTRYAGIEVIAPKTVAVSN